MVRLLNGLRVGAQFFWGGATRLFHIFFLGGDGIFFFEGWKGKSVTSSRYWPIFFGGVDSAFALVLLGRLTPFFFRRSGGKCVITGFDWLLEARTEFFPKG